MIAIKESANLQSIALLGLGKQGGVQQQHLLLFGKIIKVL